MCIPKWAATSEPRGQPPLLPCAPGLRRSWRWPALLAGPRSLRISALRMRLGQRPYREQRGYSTAAPDSAARRGSGSLAGHSVK